VDKILQSKMIRVFTHICQYLQKLGDRLSYFLGALLKAPDLRFINAL